jgi:hypothetical protein
MTDEAIISIVFGIVTAILSIIQILQLWHHDCVRSGKSSLSLTIGRRH